ncbi:twin arginine-targeting protein translocase TatB [Snodgrassella communis]|uniref:Sec-independent protein translocase protein TatB n=1 Tax=Snodgrassella communis TaxID=2946699 RepID=A0A066TIL7_9NEIS|nr:Sec-independent protein translocase protein TatB [Snodgrassella communis]KDN13377.1 Twin-arginine translocation protein TatB [Snodgrassella communis]KDN15672.1 Twin-arginine translocation protein TatB [Snodgrassella communis]PIT11630.1 twin arginine-targeting protein translocase TatB [Snodgrassella communis]PIT26323.1 twin arginine-targeting protein translocase TatB [Snodgrassella communis]PIT28857.1 twin arginine-targeting protein translocase TatB [Snodgrassella communis]
MFGLGFGEILLIAVVALVVLGPERLPKVARSAGLWVGRIQNFINNVKTELSQQAGVAEFRQARDSIEATARALEYDVNSNVRSIRGEVDALRRQLAKDESHVEADSMSVLSEPLPDYCPPVAEAPLLHRVSLRRQALQRRRDMRPRRSISPKLRIRRH